MTDNCRLIIAFFPRRHGALSVEPVRSMLAGHPLRIDRIEATDKGILVFAQSTRCDSPELTTLRETLLREGELAGYRVRLQREDLFRAMHSLTLTTFSS